MKLPPPGARLAVFWKPAAASFSTFSTFIEPGSRKLNRIGSKFIGPGVFGSQPTRIGPALSSPIASRRTEPRNGDCDGPGTRARPAKSNWWMIRSSG